MSQTTPDIRQLSTCCGKVLVWQDLGLHSSWFATCPCGARFWADRSKEASRALLWTERLLLARIAELEAALQMQVVAGGMLVEANNELRATLANERGEGDTPEVQRGCADTFRAGMRAASGVDNG